MQKKLYQLIEAFVQGNRLALSRLISYLEAHPEEKSDIFATIQAYKKKSKNLSDSGSIKASFLENHAQVLGITGPPGAGKSTLVNALIHEIRKKGESVGVVAVDPSSPISGGALLGDRIRMQEHTQDSKVFVRSLGSRGHHGGLSLHAEAVAKLMESFGFDWVILETVGVGQSECEIVSLAETTLVVLTPESGDTVQSLKAGLMEMADIFVINKADRPEAPKRVAQIRTMLDLGQKLSWSPPITLTQAHQGEGIAELLRLIQKHQKFLQQNKKKIDSDARFKKSREQYFKELLKEYFYLWFEKHTPLRQLFAKQLEKIEREELSPDIAVEEILQKILTKNIDLVE
ncbi:MAG: methylmalonyl Co-A mutase-associated GTPase MeaB [Deltaproteobacteria bacterium]|nr:methylmalonyl Co-A mutase-associated GTPase MeaB [Deltaproteobacteria bacterium]